MRPHWLRMHFRPEPRRGASAVIVYIVVTIVSILCSMALVNIASQVLL
jgi:hypothetical protein